MASYQIGEFEVHLFFRFIGQISRSQALTKRVLWRSTGSLYKLMFSTWSGTIGVATPPSTAFGWLYGTPCGEFLEWEEDSDSASCSPHPLFHRDWPRYAGDAL